jgi:autotransporter passenger strand-loop-strand repeat protein
VFGAPGARLGRAGHTTLLCSSHPFQRHQPADVVGEVLQADFGIRPCDVGSGVLEYVDSGGIAIRRTIHQGGELIVASGGVAIPETH